MPGEFTVPDDPIPATPVNPLYERQASLGLHSPKVIVVGCGGVGCWVALALVLGGVNRIYLFDGDTLSLHNLNRFPLPPRFCGELKSVALARWLEILRPEAEIIARGEFDPAYSQVEADYLVCATDSLKSRVMCHTFAMANFMGYLEVGADGERWTLSPAPPEFSTELEEQAGYQTVPVHVGPCMMAGAAAAYYVLHGVIPAVSHSVGWLGGIGELTVRTVNEDTRPRVICQVCREFGVYHKDGGLITMIKHVRESHPHSVNGPLGLAEAKAIVDKWFAVSDPTPLQLQQEPLPQEAVEELAGMITRAQAATVPIPVDPEGDPEFTNVEDGNEQAV